MHWTSRQLLSITTKTRENRVTKYETPSISDMNKHKAACLLLSAMILLMAFAVTKVRGKAVLARQDSDMAKAQAESAESQKKIAEIKLKSIDSQTSELRKVYAEWLPHFEAFQNTGDGEQRIAEVVREGDVFLISQKVKSEKVKESGLITHALIADLVIEDEYTKVLNWLGKVEEQIPSCRISKCVITRGDRGNDIHMELKILVPVIKRAPQVAQTL